MKRLAATGALVAAGIGGANHVGTKAADHVQTNISRAFGQKKPDAKKVDTPKRP